MPKKIKAQDVFVTAEAFLQACGILERTGKQGPGPGVVFELVLATIEAFTVELYLKCLILSENGLYKRGHDLLKLFKCLDAETQIELKESFEKYCAKWPAFIMKAKQYGYPLDLEGLLVRGRHAFEEFRYLHEKVGQKSNTVWGLKGLVIVIRERIVKVNPEWEQRILDMLLNPHTAPIIK